MKLHLFPCLLTWCLVSTQDGPPTSTSPSEQLPKPTYDYVVKTVYKVDENKLPSYIVDLIYNKPNENVPTADILSLYKLYDLTIDTSSILLKAIGKDENDVFTLEGFENTLNVVSFTFTDFYNSLTTILSLSGKPLRDALESLQIDSAKFSSGITYGEPDPFEELKKGNVSKASLENACSLAGLTLGQFFIGVRNTLLDHISVISQVDLVKLANSQGVTKDVAINLWNDLNVTVQDVYRVDFFKSKVDDVSQRLPNNVTLGVVTPKTNITINRVTYNLWKDDFGLISVQGISSDTTYSVQAVNDQRYTNLVDLEGSPITLPNKFTNIEVGNPLLALKDCVYVTIENDDIVVKSVNSTSKNVGTIQITLENAAELIVGSPLICDGKVYGLAREISADIITLDNFEKDFSNSSPKQFTYNIWFMTLVSSIWLIAFF